MKIQLSQHITGNANSTENLVYGYAAEDDLSGMDKVYGWYGLFVLFLPWTGFLVPVLGVWYLWYVSTFLIYDQLDTAFRIEEQLQEAFPDQYE